MGLSVAGIAAAALALLTPAVVDAKTQAIAPDHQNYVSDAGPDAYQANYTMFSGATGQQDPQDIHVGAAPGQSTYHSFVHIELDALPQGATISSLLLNLHPDNDQVNQQESYNAGTTKCPSGQQCTTDQNFAAMFAAPLKAAYPQTFDPSNPPAYDSAPKVAGVYHAADASWSFELAPLVAYWQQHGNTGLAVVPDAANTQVSWEVGFAMSTTSIRATFVPGATTASSGSGVSLTYSGTSGVPAVTLPPAAAQSLQPAAPPAAQPVTHANGTQQPAGAPAGASPAPPTGMVPIWLLVLAVCTTGAAALLAQPLSQALAAAGGFGPAIVSQLRLHPRMFGVAAVLVVWSSTFGVYANTAGRSLLGSHSYGPGGTSGASAATGTAQTGGAAAGAAGATTAAAAGASGAAAPAGGGTSQQYPNSPNPPSANLFAPNQEQVGLTDKTIFLCAHAALTFGPAFNIGASDLNVFWQMVDDQGGVWGRQVVDSSGKPGMTYEDDGYQPGKAVSAAQACQDLNTFFLLGGIGFDQIPAVRVWAEQHHELYIHHIALQAGSEGYRYSFTMLPTLEEVGQQFGQYYLTHFAGKKIGIIERNSSNWEAGSTTFKDALKAAGYGADIVADDYVQNNQGQYAQEIADMSNPTHPADVVLIWENALAAEQIINQAHQQGFKPRWLMFPFNLTLQTLAQAGVPNSELQNMVGMVPWAGYTCKSQRGSDAAFGPYQSEINQFEAAYAKYDSQANLCGGGGDLLFGTWEAWRQVYDLLYQCGRDCTRDKIAGLMLSGYHATIGANCPVDFRVGDNHHGGLDEDLYHVDVVNGTPIWVTEQPLCQRNIQ